MRGSVGRLAHSTIGEFGIVMVYLLSSPPMHAMPFERVQVCSLGFRKSHIARLLVHARSPPFARVQNIC